MVFGLVGLVVSLGQTCEQGGLGDRAESGEAPISECTYSYSCAMQFCVGFLACVVFAVSELAAIQPGSTYV